MGITKKAHYRGGNYNDQDLLGLGSIQLIRDASNADQAVRKSQAEAIARPSSTRHFSISFGKC